MQSIKTIMCPTDFSEASEYGLDFAAHLARLFSASIRLIYIRTSIWPEAIQLEHSVMESEENISNRLTSFCIETKKEFGVTCSSKLLHTTNTFEETIAEQARDCNLVVMGTNGADNYYKHFFGSNTFHVIENVKCPILAIPFGCNFKPLHSIVYAYHPETNPIFLIEELKAFLDSHPIAVKILHVSEDKPSPAVEHKLKILHDAVMVRKIKGSDWSFEAIYSDDVAFALQQYMHRHNGNILALSFHHRQLMDKLFTQNVVKKMTMIADYPIMIFRH